jgi:hypothetical protein
MIPIFLLVVGIFILILTLYFIPVIVQIAYERIPESKYLRIQASWGFFGARMRMEGDESRQEFLIGERPLYVRTVKGREIRVPEGDKELQKTSFSIRRVQCLLQLIQPISHLLGKILYSMSFQEIRGNLMVGFRNPAETGIFFGWYSALIPILMVSRVCLDITPVFDRQVLEGDIMAKVRIERPLLLILAMVRLYMDRDVRTALSGLREG